MLAPPILKRYFIALSQYTWVIPLSFIATVSAAAGFAMLPAGDTMYTASGAMAINGPPITFTNVSTQIQAQNTSLNREFLLSKDIIISVAKEVNIDPKDLFNIVQITLPGQDNAKKGGDISTYYKVSYRANDKKKAIKVVDLLIKAMIKKSETINKEQWSSIIQSIQEKDRLPKVEQELREAERNLEQYRKQEGVAIATLQNGSLPVAITNSQQQQRLLKLQLEGFDAQISSLENKLGLTADQAYIASALSADPIIANLRSQLYQIESQQAVLGKDLRPDHPQMIDLNKKQQAFSEELRQRANEVIGGNGIAAPFTNNSQIRQDSNLDPARQQLAMLLVSLKTQREATQRQLIALARSEQELKQEYAIIPNKELEEARLKQQVAIKQSFYEKMQQKLGDAQAAEAEMVSSLKSALPIEIISEEKPKKNKIVILGAGVGGGLLLGGGIVFLLSMLGGTFKIWEDIRGALQDREIPLLEVLPFVVEIDSYGKDTPILVGANSPYLEYYERLRSNLRRAGNKLLKVVLITSAGIGEGKTVTAYNLAIASARAGKRTLLIEADLRSLSSARFLKLTPEPEATLEPLRYYGQLSTCIRLVPEIENLYLVASPGPLPQSAAILESSEMHHLLEDARGRFDLVIVDAADLSDGHDAILLEPLTDGMVIVARPGYTQISEFNQALDKLIGSEDDSTLTQIRLLGGIINSAKEVIVPIPYTSGHIEPPLMSPISETEIPLTKTSPNSFLEMPKSNANQQISSKK